MSIQRSSSLSPPIYGLGQEAQQVGLGEPNLSGPSNQGEQGEIEQRAIRAGYSYLAGQNGLDSAKMEDSFRVVGVEADQSGLTQVRMNQVVKGLRVYGQELIAHVDSQGQVQELTGSYRRDLLSTRINLHPAITNKGALERVRQSHHGTVSSPKTEQLIYPTARGARLAYRIEFLDEKGPARMIYFIDARSGRVLNKQNILMAANGGINAGIVPSAASPNPAFFKPLDLNLRRKAEMTNFVERTRQRSTAK